MRFEEDSNVQKMKLEEQDARTFLKENKLYIKMIKQAKMDNLHEFFDTIGLIKNIIKDKTTDIKMYMIKKDNGGLYSTVDENRDFIIKKQFSLIQFIEENFDDIPMDYVPDFSASEIEECIKNMMRNGAPGYDGWI